MQKRNTLKTKSLLACFSCIFLVSTALQAQVLQQKDVEIKAEWQHAHEDAPSAQLRIDTTETTRILDSIYIAEVEKAHPKPKVLHAEPLFIDLIRDLGARKGEREWNVGFGLTDKQSYDEYEALVEYEWAPIDRLGLEIELPFTMYQPRMDGEKAPQNRLNSLKLAAQWSFFVSEKLKTSMAIGYLHEFELTPFENFGKSRLYTGNVYNPFFVAAKRWGNNYHTLVYAGPMIGQLFETGEWHTTTQINTNLHYMIPGTRNFVGIEFNKEVAAEGFQMVMRPQMRVGITDDLLIGIVAGIPIERESERLSFFVRMIYEPPHKPRKSHK
jgi:hypothetical protein